MRQGSPQRTSKKVKEVKAADNPQKETPAKRKMMLY